jgi:hypothetical protein
MVCHLLLPFRQEMAFVPNPILAVVASDSGLWLFRVYPPQPP